MSKKRDYTRYSKESVEPIDTIEVVGTTETVEEPKIEETKVEETKVEETKVEEMPKIEKPKYLTGVVTDCPKLNVRLDPYPSSTILGVVAAGTEVIVIEAESTDDFYRICTSAGLEGYCMKKFVTITP